MEKTTFNIKNLNKETPLFWRRLGNAVLAMSAGAPMVINQFTFSPEWKDNLIGVVGLVGLLAKGLTTLFAKNNV